MHAYKLYNYITTNKKKKKTQTPSLLLCPSLSSLLTRLCTLRSKLSLPASPAISSISFFLRLFLSRTLIYPETREGKGNALPVAQVPVTLRSLSGEVDKVAAEEEVVCGRDGEGVAHEGCRVDGESAGHCSGDAGWC